MSGASVIANVSGSPSGEPDPVNQNASGERHSLLSQISCRKRPPRGRRAAHSQSLSQSVGSSEPMARVRGKVRSDVWTGPENSRAPPESGNRHCGFGDSPGIELGEKASPLRFLFGFSAAELAVVHFALVRGQEIVESLILLRVHPEERQQTTIASARRARVLCAPVP